MDAKQYISLEVLAAKIKLPQKYLRQLVQSGDIPSLRIGRFLRFDVADVRKALSELAAKPSKPQKKTVYGVRR